MVETFIIFYCVICIKVKGFTHGALGCCIFTLITLIFGQLMVYESPIA